MSREFQDDHAGGDGFLTVTTGTFVELKSELRDMALDSVPLYFTPTRAREVAQAIFDAANEVEGLGLFRAPTPVGGVAEGAGSRAQAEELRRALRRVESCAAGFAAAVAEFDLEISEQYEAYTRAVELVEAVIDQATFPALADARANAGEE